MLNFIVLPPALWVCLGASAGALLRWQLSVHLTAAWAILSANYLGCFIMGALMALSLNDENKLLLITGFLGSLTTFSAFSAQVVHNLLLHKWFVALTNMVLHTFGSITLTLLAFGLVRWLHGFQAT